MPIPDFQTLMLPLLRLAADGHVHKFRDAVEALAVEFELSADERAELLPSGTYPLFDNRVGWARTHLKQAGLVASERRGYFEITQRGRELLAETPTRIDMQLLMRYPEFVEFRTRRRDSSGNTDDVTSDPVPSETPEDALARAYKKLRGIVEAELIQLVKSSPPAFFERLVLDLLVKMGYGGSREEAATAVGRSGDGGIDGIIVEDRLGLDVIYIQAKRWDGVVGRPEIQRFAGALQGQRARKGIFITTSGFTRDAVDYASRIDSRIILTDGERLTQLMVDYNVGVSTVGNYEVKKVDSDYFTDI